MTTVEILYRYATPPTESAAFALAGIKDVYGIRRLGFDRAARTLTQLVRQAGLDLDAELPLILPYPAPEPVPPA